MSRLPKTLEIEQVIRDVVARGPVLSEDNTTLRDIAKAFGVKHQWVSLLVKRLGLEWPLMYRPRSAPRSQWPGPGGKTPAWRRANGICLLYSRASHCHGYAVPGMVLCQMHREMNGARGQALIKAAQAAGLCVAPGCKNKPVTTGYCVEHNDLQNVQARLHRLYQAKRQHRALRGYNRKSTKFGYNSNGSGL